MKSLSFFLLSLVISASVFADSPALNENPVTLNLTISPSEIQAGGTGKISIDMAVNPTHHAYKDMIKLKWLGLEGVVIDPPEVSPVRRLLDKFTKKERDVVENHGVVTAVLHFPTNVFPGKHDDKINFTYQACSETYCLFPKTVPLAISYTIVGPNIQSPTDKESEGFNDFHKALARGRGWAFLFVFIAGFLTSLTPCIFPMIPITISIIGARSTQNKKSKSFALSVTYVLEIAFTYSALGVIAASTGAFFGSALSNIYVVSGIAVVFIGMGFSMLGLFELQVPASIRNKFGGANTGTGLPGAFLAGLFAGIVASPCIGPVLVGILTFVAQTAQVGFGFLLLFCFAMGMGILFIVLGTFSGLLTKLPKAGPWMETVKVIFGVTFIGMALYYLYPVVSRETLKIIAAALLIFIASYFGAFAPATPQKIGQLKKGLMLTGFAVGLFLIASVLLPHTSTPSSASGNAGPTSQLNWQTYDSSQIKTAAQTHKPVLIDFSAEWCVACHELDAYTYSDSRVVAESHNFLLFKVDATTDSPEIQKLQKLYKVVGLPTVLFIDVNGTVRDDLTVTGFVKAEDFLDKMKKSEN